VLSGLRPPLAWIAREGRADWRFASSGEHTRVEWRYDFTLASPFVWPLAALVLNVCMRIAMARCLGAMAVLLEGAPADDA
jgi:hypothetical protein